MLNAAILALCFAAPMGMWLSSQHLLDQGAYRHAAKVAALHGIAGITCVTLLFLALRGPSTKHPGGAGTFGWLAFSLLFAAMLGGLTILTFNLRRRAASPVIIALHSCIGIFGAVLLAAYFSTPASFGR